MKWKTKCILCAAPSLLGILIFYIVPFIKIIYYSFIESQFNKIFVGFDNYNEILANDYFWLALKNTMLTIFICVPIILIAAILISAAINERIKNINILSLFSVIPMVIPTAAIVPVWKTFFANADNIIPIYLLFVWKNIGICIVLISASMSAISRELYEASRLDGADGYLKHRYITIPCAAPAIIFSILLTIVNSFKIYKESYLYYNTNYPPEHSYTLQYFMNNNFMKLDYQALSCSSVINMLIILAIVLFMLKIQRKYSC